MAMDDTGGHPSSLEYHRMLLEDPRRIDAYERAIRSLVKPGDVVLDVGTGSGIFALLAARAGAARVHAVESMPVARLAQELVACNQLSDVVHVHHTNIVDMTPAEPVDLIVSDFMGHFVVDDGMLDAVRAAAGWMKEDARFCPSRVAMKLAPVVDVKFRAIDFWEQRFLGLDLRPGRRLAFQSFYLGQLREEALAATPLLHGTFQPPDTTLAARSHHQFDVTRAGQLRAIAGWFDAQLTPEIVLSTAPGIPTHWGQILFPLPSTAVEVGDRVHFELEQLGGERTWRWSAKIETAAGTVECALDAAQWGEPDD